ncbi:MAG: hypothetical protein HQK99_09005 [Nitrospirae bacterium]|nr:hypothetical protein [Nitrospirota bacterium]
MSIPTNHQLSTNGQRRTSRQIFRHSLRPLLRRFWKERRHFKIPDGYDIIALKVKPVQIGGQPRGIFLKKASTTGYGILSIRKYSKKRRHRYEF